MEQEKQKIKMEEKIAEAPIKENKDNKAEHNHEHAKEGVKLEDKKEEVKLEDKKEEKAKKIEQKKVKRDKASVQGLNIGISTKHAIFICRMIKGKRIEEAIPLLEKVIAKKVFVPMTGELPSRRGGIPGRYPLNASREFIKLLKSLNANAAVNGIDNPYIETAIANLAPRPFRRFGSRRFKKTHVLLVAKEFGGKKNEHKK